MIGTTVSRYRIVAELGRGGMGVVYRAEDVRLHRPVALKFLPDGTAGDRAALDRFEREARSASALDHPNICTVYDVGAHEGRPFIVMQLLEGQTLRQRLQTRIGLDELLEIGVQIASGLDAAHAKGIVHRDIKPANIFLGDRGVAKILDFGLAKLAGDRPRGKAAAPDLTTVDVGRADLTVPGATLGTVAYMSPEQARGEALDARTDLFSFGVVLYEMATGRRPFAGDSLPAILGALLHTTPPAATDVNPALPASLDPILAKALEPDRALRYQSAADLRADLERLRRARASGQVSTTAVGGERRGSRRAAILAAVALIAAVGAAGWWYARPGTRRGGPIDSVAVLPFTNTTGDPDTEYLSDGLTDGLINALSRVQHLRVVPRSTMFRYKNRAVDPEAVGHELGVRAVVSGRVTQRDNMLSVGAELIDVARRGQVWGDQYDRRMTDILAIHTEITRQIADNLRLRLTGEEASRLTRTWTENTEAYRLYLKGLFHRQKTTEEGFNESIRQFEQAVALDPRFALAYAGLSDSLGSLGYLAIRPSADVWPKAKAAAQTALALDASLPEAHAALGHAILRYDWDWPAARAEIEKAIELDPDYGIAHHWYAHYWFAVGERDRLMAASRRAVECEPLDLMLNAHLLFMETGPSSADSLMQDIAKVREIAPDFWAAHTTLGLSYVARKQFDEGLRELETGVERSGRMPLAVVSLGTGYTQAGAHEQTRRIIAEFERRPYVPPTYLARLYRQLGEKDLALSWLERGYRERDGNMIDIAVMFSDYLTDPRFQDLLRRVGLRPPT